MSEIDQIVNKPGPEGFVAWKVSERNLDQIAKWAGGSVDLAQPAQGVFIPTLEGPVLARLGSIVIKHTRTGRFEIDEDAKTIEQLEANIQETEDDLTSSPEFESEEDLQAHHQRKTVEQAVQEGIPVNVRKMRMESAGLVIEGDVELPDPRVIQSATIRSASIDNDGLGHIILGPADSKLG